MSTIGIDPNYDHLYDAQQKNTDHFPVCDCCGHFIYPRERFYVLALKRKEIFVCEDCKTEMEESCCTAEDMSPLC